MDSIPSREFPREKGSPVLELPLSNAGPTDFFPPVCLQSHWDPTAILRRTLPDGYVPQSTDPRPWTRICMEYTTAGDEEEAPAVNPSIVMPNGGAFYPASRYMEAINNESKLRALDRPLGTCEGNQWEPTLNSDMYNSHILVPERTVPSDPSKIQELAYPKALLRSGPYDCRAANDAYAVQTTSDFIFNNATKQDRYKSMKKGTRPQPPAAPLKAAPETLRPDLTFNAGPPRPVAPSMIAVVAGSTTRKEAPVYQSGSEGGVYYNPSDLRSAMARSEQVRAGSAQIPWIDTPDANPARSYELGAANQRADLIANTRGPPRSPMITAPFADNSSFAAF